MFPVRFAVILPLLSPALLLAQSSSPTKDEPPPVPVVRLAPEGTVPQRALRFRLLPQRSELQPGNAATLWIRAGHSAREVSKKPSDDWLSPSGTPLKAFPKKEVRDLLAAYGPALRLADQAARRERCDWEMPPFDLVNWDFPFSEIQGCRELARLLTVRCRLELSEGDYDAAARTLSTGLALARHLGDSDTLVQGLVGIAISAIMFGHVEEWMQIPGSPNLYWSLTALPVPFIDIRRAMEFELNNLNRALPELDQIRKGLSDPARSDKVMAQVTEMLTRMEGRKTQEWEVRLGMAAFATKFYPPARLNLIAAGHKPEALEKLSAVQVVLLDQVEHYDRFRDDVMKQLALPPWQARAGLEAVEKEIRKPEVRMANPFVNLLFPAVMKVYEACIRQGRTIAALRCGEAMRLYAASHDGKAPEKFTDITAVPLPIDPATGKGFEGFYSVKDGRGVLDVPTTMPGAPQLGRRFEIGDR